LLRKITAIITIFSVLTITSACGLKNVSSEQDNNVIVKLMIGRDKQWIFDEVQKQLIQNNVTINGKAIKILTDKAGTGEAMEKIIQPESDYIGWMPASSTYVMWANEQWYQRGNTKPRVNEDAITVFLTPTVIAMKEFLAQRMGYPQREIGWEDVLNLSTVKEGWGIYGDPSLNPVRFSHTNPAKSNSGMNSLIAAEYAFSNKTNDLSLEDIKRNSSKLKAVEQTIVHYGESTSLLQKKIVEKGTQFIQYAVLYEYMVVDMNKKYSGMEKTVAIYPKEGTIWGDVSFTEVYSANVSNEQKQALKIIKEMLLKNEIQIKGMNEYYFRPANTNVPLSNVISTINGVNPTEPKTTLELPKLDIINSILADWTKNMKKRANVTFVLDTSESMNGEALNNVKEAIKSITARNIQGNEYNELNAEDYISIIDFNSDISESYTVRGNETANINSRITGLRAKGTTRLYDAILQGIESNMQVSKSIKGENKRINVVVVLTDGIDTNSLTKYEQLVKYIDSQQGNLPVIITVGYGNVDENKLIEIADKTGGKYYQGDPNSIKQLFEEIKTYF